jgi:hypothetical protein
LLTSDSRCFFSFSFLQQLYKQRFFVQHLPLLLSLFNGAPSTASSSSGAAPAASPRFVVLLALAHLLQHVPQKVLMDARSTVSHTTRQ